MVSPPGRGLGRVPTTLDWTLRAPICLSTINTVQPSSASRPAKAKPAGLRNRVRRAASCRAAPSNRSRGTPSCPPHLPRSTRPRAKPSPGHVWPSLLSCSALTTFSRSRLTVRSPGVRPAAPPGAPRPPVPSRRQTTPAPARSARPARAPPPTLPQPHGGPRPPGAGRRRGGLSRARPAARAPRRPRRDPERPPRPARHPPTPRRGIPAAEARAEAAGSVGRRHPRPVVSPLPAALPPPRRAAGWR